MNPRARSRFRKIGIVAALLLMLSVSTNAWTQSGTLQEAVELNTQIVNFYGKGRYQEAIPLAQRALAIREKTLGPQHPDTALSLNNLAELYRATGAYAQAEPLYKRALAINEKALGTEHPVTALSLNNLALLYDHTGAYSQAEALLRRALAIREKTLGPQHPETATSLNNLAELYRATGAYAQAEPLYTRALAINEKALGPEHPATAASLANLALLYHDTGAYGKAEPLYRRALTIRENTVGSDHPDTATSLTNLGELYRDTGAYAKAEPLYRRALEINEKALGAEHPATATSLNNLAGFYRATGAYAQAVPLLQRALTINEKALGAEHPATANSLNNLAELYRANGAYAQAEPLYNRALAINEKALGPEHPASALSLNNLALLYYHTGAYSQAEALLQRALAIREKALGPEHPQTATSLNNLAELYLATGAYAKAEPLYRRALAINEKAFGPEHPATALSLNNLAELHRITGASAQAVPLHQRALAIREKALGPEHPDIALSLNNLALLNQAVGAYAQAELQFRRALTINEKALGPEHPVTATLINNLAALLYDTGAYAQAEPLFQRALAIREKALGPNHPDTATSLNNLAVLYQATSAYTQAEPLHERALRIDENNTARFLLSGAESRKRAYLEQRVRNIYGYLSLSLVSQTSRARVLGLTAVLQYKGRVLDAMSDSVARLRQSVTPEDRTLFDQLAAVAQQFSILTFGGTGSVAPEAYRARLDALAREQERLEGELSARSATFRQEVAPITLERVRQALPVDAVLVEWFRFLPFDPKAKEGARWGAPRYVAYVLKRSGDPVAIDLGGAAPIETLVAEFRTALSDRQSTYVKNVAEELSEKLIKPLQPHLARSERLLLSPDAALNLVPFAALLDEDGQYLAQRVELTYLTSGRDLLRMAAALPSRGSTVVVANPAYGSRASGQVSVDTGLQPARAADLDTSGPVFTPLAGTAAEAKALQTLFKLDEKNVLTGANATEARLRQLRGPRILHVATHGFFLNDRELTPAALRPVGSSVDQPPLPLVENPLLRSGLALAGANARSSGGSDDGILTAAEVAQLDLGGTQLVVLSACETAVGQVKTGEGVYGLRRALVLAGAQTQLVSLWKVADAATVELMVDYYQRLLNGEGRSGALRSVQKAMLANPARQHPYYWAAFVPIGNWTSLQKDP